MAYVKEKDENKILYYSLLNICATVCVVWLHFNNEIHWYAPTLAWKQAVFVQVIAFWAVPIFFMLSGATLINYRSRYTTKQFFIKRIKRVLIPFLIWGCIFAIWRMHQGELILTHSNALELQWAVINMFVNNQMEPVYWFFPPLFAIYLSMPALSCFTEKKNRPILRYLLFVGVITISIIPFTYNLICTILNNGVGWWNSSWQLQILGGYLLFPLLGYWCSTHDFKIAERIICYLLAILSSIIRLVGIFYLFPRDGQKPQVLFDYLSFPSVFLALAIFIIFKYSNWSFIKRRKWLSHTVYKLADCSFGVYLIHIIILTKIENISFFNLNVRHFLLPIVCYFFCVLLVYIVKKIPVLKFLFP